MTIDILVLITFGTIFIMGISIPDRYLNRITEKIHDSHLMVADQDNLIYQINYRKLKLKIAAQVIFIVLAAIAMTMSSRLMVRFALAVMIVLVIAGVRFTVDSINKEIWIEDGHLRLYRNKKLLESYDLRLLRLIGIKSVVPGRYLSYYYLEFDNDNRLYLNPNFENWHQLVALALTVFADRSKLENKGVQQ